MNLDAFSVIVVFLAVVEAVLGAAALALGVREFRAAAGAANGSPEAARRPLLALVAGTVLVTAVVSVPLFHLLLASWVPRWPGIMCVEGVRRIGTGTAGAARWLPPLVAALDVTRLLVVFAAGAWWTLRRLPGEPIPVIRRAALAAAVLGAVALLDGALAGAYVVIPKAEVYPTSGCCTVARAAVERDAGLVSVGAEDAGRELLSGLLVAGAAVLGGAALLVRRGAPVPGNTAAVAGIAVLGAALLVPAGRFLVDVGAPVLLDLPYHHCAWCALAGAPEAVAGTVLLSGAAMCAGWALLARLGGPAGEDSPARSLLGAAAFGFLAAAAMAAVIAGMA